VQICPQCGEENPDRFRLCGICGTKLAPEAPPQEVRKTVTIVFCDLKGSTSLGERLDTEALREVLAAYFSEMKAVLEQHGGTVEKFIGDAVMAVFGLPVLHEDDALRAVRAAYDMKLGLARLNDTLETRWGVRLENRTGVNTGEVVAGDVTAGQRLVTGDAVNTAARLEQAAPPLEILIGEPTYRLVKDAIEVEPVDPLSLKGKAEAVPAYRLVAVKEGEGEGVARRLDAPMVGRADQLHVLVEALDGASAQRRAQRVTVLGTAGVGKSRLLREFVGTTAERSAFVRGRCLSYGQGITFFPLAEMVRGAADIQNDDPLEVARGKLAALLGPSNADVTERLAATIGLSAAMFPQEETFWSVRRFLEILATRKPLIVLVEDIHWAEQTLLDLIDYVVDSVRDAPMVIVASSRPDLREDHPEWFAERDDAKWITLEPLSLEESSVVVNNLLGTTALNEEARARIIEAAEGNPLFVEQMLSMLIDDGILQRGSGEEWILISDLGAFTIPPTISALLTARLDRLGSSERAVVERGAVIGQVFFRGAVEDLAPEPIRERVGPSLTNLVRKEFIRPGKAEFAGQETYAFLHGLIRDAAYHGLLKRTRADLHEKFVAWAERVAPERVLEYEEILGYHLEEAFLILAQLGPIDEHGREVGIHGARLLASAGRRALARGDMPAAANLLYRAAHLLPEADPIRPRLLLLAGEAFLEQGHFEMADAALAMATEEAELLGDRGLQTSARLVRLELHFVAEGAGSEEDVIAEVEKAIPVLESENEHEGLARVWRLLWSVHMMGCRYGAGEQAAQRVIEHAEAAGDVVMQARALPWLAVCAEYGPTAVSDAIKTCQEILGKVGNDRKSEANTLRVLAHLEAMQGNFDRSRELYAQVKANLEELGWKRIAALAALVSGGVEMLAGDPAAAERELRHSYEVLHELGEKNYISTIAGDLAEALYQQGRFDEAIGFSEICQELGSTDDIASQVRWRSVRGKVWARRGETESAESLVREALSLIRRSDDLSSQGDTLMDLAEILQLSGKQEEAAAALSEALDLYERKGNLVSARKARELLNGTHAAAPTAATQP
jgi:class 3 adenylate cyclase/tetratricopeptide (TPR) repeat protein